MRRLALLAATVTALLAAPAAGAAVPDDTYWPLQWGPQQLRASQAWDTSTGAGQTIAIVDSGIDLGHPDLAAKIAGGVTFIDCAAEPDGCGNGDWLSGGPAAGAGEPHGTHVAGIAAAATGNGTGIAGTAPDATLLAVKALGEQGGSFEDIAAGIRWAVDHGADVINMSLGAQPGVQALTYTGVISDVRDAIAYARSKDVVVVAAAGNDFASICGTPAFEDGALCVAATDRNEARAVYSNFTVKPDMHAVAAPGGAAVLSCRDDIVSTVPLAAADGSCETSEGATGYDFYAGTSMASPHVAGVAALLKAQGRSAAQVVSVLESTARTPITGTRGTFTPMYGYGIVDAAAAVAAP
jgi:subtilisin family serine protease